VSHTGDPAARRAVENVSHGGQAPPLPWKPARVRFIESAKYWGRCFWCGERCAPGDSIVWYADEREPAHAACHEEACT
jgi:hypothetical protein